MGKQAQGQRIKGGFVGIGPGHEGQDIGSGIVDHMKPFRVADNSAPKSEPGVGLAALLTSA
jgi:hypothetical protein